MEFENKDPTRFYKNRNGSLLKELNESRRVAKVKLGLKRYF